MSLLEKAYEEYTLLDAVNDILSGKKDIER